MKKKKLDPQSFDMGSDTISEEIEFQAEANDRVVSLNLF